MGRLIEKVRTVVGEQKQTIKKYSLTFAIIYLVTFMMIVLGFKIDNIEKIYTLFILTDVFIFAIESIFDFKWYRIPMYVIALLLSIAANNTIYSETNTEKQIMFIAGIYMFTVIIAIYKIIKDSNVSFSQFVIRVFNNGIIISIASAVIQIGSLFIAFIIASLLFSNTDIYIYLKTEIFTLGFIIIPSSILALLYVKNEVMKPVSFLISYIMLTIVIIAEVVIYIYFIKILILREIPSNVIFPIISGLFMGAYPTCIMINGLQNKNKYIEKNITILPIAFIPLICMQIYSIGVRIAEYGTTPERYLGVILVLFEIVAVILSFIKEKKHYSKIVLIAAAFTLVVMCIPGINVIDFSWKSQLRRLTSVYKQDTNFDSLSQADKDIAKGAYEYLKYDEEGEKHIPSYIDKETMNKKLFNNDGYQDYNYGSINYNPDTKEIPVEGFKKAREVEIYSYTNSSAKNLDFNKLKIYNDKDLNDKIEKEMRLFIEKTIDTGKIINKRVDFDSNTSLWITRLNIRYRKNNKEIESLSISGYLLTK